MNTYNIFRKNEESTILYHAVAHDEAQVKKMAASENIDINEMEVELERSNVRTELGRDPQACIKDALVY